MSNTAHPSPSVPSTPDPARPRTVVLACVCLAALVLPLSFSGGTMATPAIGREFTGSPAALAWVTNAFMLSFGSLLMAAGTLADRHGRRRVFGTGMALFVGASLLLPLAGSLMAIDLLRALQGVAAAAALAGGTAALAQEFDAAERPRAFAWLGTTFGAGLAFGPVVAGALVQHLGWRSVFVAGALVGAAALAFGLPRLRESRDPQARALDAPGTLCFTAALVLLTFGVMQAAQPGAGGTSAALLAGALALAVLFVAVERRVARPMLDLSLFRHPRFVGVQMLPVATSGCYVVLLVLMPLRLIGVEGHAPAEAGLLLMPLSLPMLFMPALAARLSRRCPAGTVCAAGLLVAAAGLWALQCATPADSPVLLAGALALIGIGAGLPWGLMDGLSVSVVPRERAGMATGIFSTMRVASEGVALATALALLGLAVRASLGGGAGVATGADREALAAASQWLAAGQLSAAAARWPAAGTDALVLTYHQAFRHLLSGLIAITLLCAAVVFATLRRPKPSTAQVDV